jgi:uncharacterized DUF497 family protein
MKRLFTVEHVFDLNGGVVLTPGVGPADDPSSALPEMRCAEVVSPHVSRWSADRINRSRLRSIGWLRNSSGIRRKRRRTSRNMGSPSKEALTVFADPLAKVFDDPEHSDDEPRELIIGHSAERRLLIVSFTDRGRRTRVIGARETTARERRDYEQNSEKKST